MDIIIGQGESNVIATRFTKPHPIGMNIDSGAGQKPTLGFKTKIN